MAHWGVIRLQLGITVQDHPSSDLQVNQWNQPSCLLDPMAAQPNLSCGSYVFFPPRVLVLKPGPLIPSQVPGSGEPDV